MDNANMVRAMFMLLLSSSAVIYVLAYWVMATH
jgi:hypothetical protein